MATNISRDVRLHARLIPLSTPSPLLYPCFISALLNQAPAYLNVSAQGSSLWNLLRLHVIWLRHLMGKGTGSGVSQGSSPNCSTLCSVSLCILITQPHNTVNLPSHGIVFSIRVIDRNPSPSYFIDKKPKFQREQVTGPRSHSQFLTQTGI